MMGTVNLSREVARGFATDVDRFVEQLREWEAWAGDKCPAVDQLLLELMFAIRAQCRACLVMERSLATVDELQRARQRFQEAIDPWFRQSWFMRRAKLKPRGYPGDYELLSAIYDGEPRSRGLGGYLDLYFLQSDLGRAVPARMQAARDFLSRQFASASKRLQVLNVACGPCREYFVGLDGGVSAAVDIVCIDSDEAALEFVKSQWGTRAQGAGGWQPSLEFVNYNALRMRSAAGNLRRFGGSDIIYSIGLLDYIPDDFLVPMLEGLRLSLNPGGMLFVAFKDTQRYDHIEYQWFVDWFFFQRDEEQCRELLQQAGFAETQITLTRDRTGIILNFQCRNDGGSPLPRREDARDMRPRRRVDQGNGSPSQPTSRVHRARPPRARTVEET